MSNELVPPPQPRTLTLVEIKEILESGCFETFIGGVEDRLFECKREPYFLDDDKRNRELAKDVSAFANARGGTILLGIETRSDPVFHADEIISVIRSFSRDRLEINRYHQVLRDWLYPTPDVEIKWFQSQQNAGSGIAAIFIPPLQTDRGPFLLRNPVEENNRSVAIVVGYVERRLATATPSRIEDIHRWIQDGRRFENLLNEQFDSLRVAIQGQVLPSSENPFTLQSDLTSDLYERIDPALVHAELQNHPAFILSAVPYPRVEIPTLFSARDAEIIRLLENPPKLRAGGFDLDTGAPPRIIRGELRRAVTPGYKLLDLWQDGILIFAATGDKEFLSWGKHTIMSPAPLRINQLVLIEATYLFVELVRQIMGYFDSKPERIRISLGLRNMTVGGTPCGLIPGPVDSDSWKFGGDIHRAPGSDNRWTVIWQTQNFEPGVIAMDLIKRVYAWFSIEEDRIPYTEQLEGQRVISRKMLEQIGHPTNSN